MLEINIPEVVAEVAEAFRRYVCERPQEEWFVEWFGGAPQDEGFWLSIGWLSGKHATLLCCDRAHGDHGCVVDHHFLRGATGGK